ncbi:MAG TPA: hypothetical protein VGN75_15110 [Kaistia sp.]|jgi:hypothetical protein|nr:hypothetical protein [Kaistia sp.]
MTDNVHRLRGNIVRHTGKRSVRQQPLALLLRGLEADVRALLHEPEFASRTAQEDLASLRQRIGMLAQRAEEGRV